MKRRLRLVAVTMFFFILSPTHRVSASEFVLDFDPKLEAWQEGDPFQQRLYVEIQRVLNVAVESWSYWILDDVTIYLRVKLEDLPVSAMAAGGVLRYAVPYVEFLEALRGDRKSPEDHVAVDSLPLGPSFEFYRADADGAIILDTIDDGDSSNNEMIHMPSGIARSIGLLDPHSEHLDGFLSVNSLFPAALVLEMGDFDQGDGIDPLKTDVTGIVMHEIGHALGFLEGPASGRDLDHGIYPLDLFSYGGEVELMVPYVADGGSLFFSIDGGRNAIAEFSNGSRFPRGHWYSTTLFLDERFVLPRLFGVMASAIDSGGFSKDFEIRSTRNGCAWL